MSNVAQLQRDLERIIQELPLPDDRQRNVFRQYFEAFKIVFTECAPGSILEIGSGFSTYLLAKLAEGTDTRITSVDLDLGRNFKQLVDTCGEGPLKERVHFINGLTCRYEELREFNETDIWEKFGDVPISDLLPALDRYIVLTEDKRKFDKLIDHYGLQSTLQDLKNFLFRDGVFHIDPYLREVFGYSSERDFVKANEHLYPAFASEVLGEPRFDVIFFDSGEFSNNIEFFKLKDKIPSGGYAVFHDITFPKSFKNFLPCAYVQTKQSEWEVVYADTQTTPQGIMVARRL